MNALEAVATMVNTLDTSIFERMACDQVVWESQAVFTPHRGRAAVLEYLNDKYELIREVHAYPIAELACWRHPEIPDCFVVEQCGAMSSTTFVQDDG